VAHHIRRDARVQQLEEVDRGFGPRVMDDERGLSRNSLVEESGDLVRMVAQVLGVQGAARLDL
jgi:hypothetical protein